MDRLQLRCIAMLLASGGSCEALLLFCQRHWHDLEDVLLDILTYIPETTDPREYIPILMLTSRLENPGDHTDKPEETKKAEIDIQSALLKSQGSAAARMMNGVNLESLSMDKYLYRRVHQVHQITGLVQYELTLLSAFPDILPEWRLGIIQPLKVLQSCGVSQSIEYLESIKLDYAIATLLGSTKDDDLECMLEEVLIPWSNYKGLSDELCIGISDRMANSAAISLRGVLRTLSTFIQSDVSSAGKEKIASGALLACYKKPLFFDGKDHTAERQTIVAILQNTCKKESRAPLLDPDQFEIFGFHMLEEQMLDPESPVHQLILPYQGSIDFLKQLISASEIFGSIRLAIEARFSNEKTQRSHLTRLLRSNRTDVQVRELRKALLSNPVLSKLSHFDLDYGILKSLLLSNHCELAQKIYVTASPRPLPSGTVESIVLEAYQELFDNAKSLSRKELGLANRVLAVIHPKHENARIRRAQMLTDVLIELSSYKGSNENLPIQIQAFDSEQALGLFARILQEGGNYKKHFRLLGLYQNLSLALDIPITEDRFHELVINAALSCDDLDFALGLADNFIQDSFTESSDETEQYGGNWRIVYLVCKFPTESREIVKRQIDLLSYATTCCPPNHIYQLNNLYQRLESIATDIASNEKSELAESSKVAQDNSGLPRFSHQESSASGSSEQRSTIEMPQWKLFEAAQAATQAARTYLPRSGPGNSQHGEGRVRKRDQIAGLVGSGVGAVESRFTSGLGWILGAE